MVLEDVYEIVGNVDNKTININKDYYESLLKNYENKNINTTVKIFYEEVLSKSAANKYSFKNTVDTVERFLYNTYLESRNDFSKLFFDKSSVLRNNVSTKDYQIISKFLEWENKEKETIKNITFKYKEYILHEKSFRVINQI